jgi:hypothetical protein
MDPGVRLAYELYQVDALQGAAATASAAAGVGASGASGSAMDSVEVAGPAAAAAAVNGSGKGVLPGLGPWIRWDKVSSTSAAFKTNATEAAAAVATAAKAGLQAPLFMECCDLRMGRSYVDFLQDCHMVNVLASGHTSEYPE